MDFRIIKTFAEPKTGCITVKVINRLGDEVMKVFSVNDLLATQ